ncbi:MAG: HAD-IA family hydrolase [Rickettsiales bacterium]|nr:HAD-IA family hydrolase [Rickettsiales bacterium]
MPLLRKVQSAIEGVKVVSFDIFDTLLLRPYLRPTDLFYHLEQLEDLPNFAVARMEAEQSARAASGKEDISLDAIYKEIGETFRPLREKEQALEMQVLRANPEMMEVWKFVIRRERNLKVIVTSDMYLPADFLAQVLKKNGFGGYRKLYVSGDCGKTKVRGSLYKHIQEDLGVSAGEILHIGDNRKSDYGQAKKCGLKAILYEKVIKQYLKSDRRASIYKKRAGRSLGASILLSLLAWHWHKKQIGLLKADYWENLGYNYAGPVAYGYTRWIEQEAKLMGIENLLFVARDGYTLRRVFDLFGVSGIRTDYVYASRFMNLIYRLDYIVEDKWPQAVAIVEYFAAKNKEVAELSKDLDPRRDGWKEYHGFIAQHTDLFRRLTDVEFRNYKNYLGGVVHSASNVGLVDTVAMRFSSYRLIKSALAPQVKVRGFYWSVVGTMFRKRCNYSHFAKGETETGCDYSVFTENWDFMEFLLTSPEYPTRNVTTDGLPVYDPLPQDYEKIRAKVYPRISDNAVSFAQDVLDIFGNLDIFLHPNNLVEYINCFCNNPKRDDRKNMAIIQCGIDAGHKEYVPLFSIRIPFRQIFTAPFKSLRLVKRARWRTPLQTLMICLCHPIGIKMRGLKQLEIYLFPRLSHQYFTLSLNVKEGVYYRFIVGSKRGAY